jgi:hypothetical protein
MSTTLDREAQIADLKRHIAALERRNAPMPAGMRDELSRVQARYDAVDREFGLGAPEAVAPLLYETGHQYRQRRLAGIIKYSDACKHVRADMLGEESIGPIEERAIADAVAAARDDANFKPFEIRSIKERDPSGREITRWVGDSLAWRQHFMSGAQIGRIRSPGEIKDRFAQ